MDPERDTVQRTARTPNWTTLALIGALLALVVVIAYFVTRGSPEQDKLTQNQVAQSQQQAKAPPVDKVCASKPTYELIKRELFRRAAQLRGGDQAAFDQLSSYAVVRMDNPVMESQNSTTGAVNCSGSLSLDLPPGVVVVGGRHSLSSDVDYTVQPAADDSGNVVVLRNADSVVTPLATLARVGERVPQSAAPTPSEEPSTPQEEANVAASESAAKVVGPKTTAYPGRPSFDCSKARTRGEIAVCSNSGLSELDENMAIQYRQAIEGASPDQKELLQRTRNRFIGYRDRCPNRSCIAAAYVGRMREIRDIVEGRWRPER